MGCLTFDARAVSTRLNGEKSWQTNAIWWRMAGWMREKESASEWARWEREGERKREPERKEEDEEREGKGERGRDRERSRTDHHSGSLYNLLFIEKINVAWRRALALKRLNILFRHYEDCTMWFLIYATIFPSGAPAFPFSIRRRRILFLFTEFILAAQSMRVCV